MIFGEWVDKYGIESARSQFGLSDHLVIVVKPNRYVTGTCGRWHGSEPLRNKKRNPDEATAIQRLKDSLQNSFDTFEIIRD